MSIQTIRQQVVAATNAQPDRAVDYLFDVIYVEVPR